MFKAFINIFLHFINKNKILFSFLCLVQILSIFASLFVYSFFVSNKYADMQYDVSKTYTISFNKDIPNNTIIKQIKHFESECNLDLKMITIKSEKDDFWIMFDYLYYPDHAKYGRYFNSDEFKSNCNVIIACKEYFPGVIDGDTVSIDDKNYTVIGTNDYEDYNILPMSSFNTIKHNNDKISITLKDYPNTQEYNRISILLSTCFKNSEIIYPQRVEDNNILWNDSTILIFIGIFLLSIINVAFVYLYILESNNEIVYVFRLNGATKGKCIFILFAVIFLLALISFILGCFLSRFTLPYIINFIAFETFSYSLGFENYIYMITKYLAVVLIILIPFIKNYVKKLSVSNHSMR